VSYRTTRGRTAPPRYGNGTRYARGAYADPYPAYYRGDGWDGDTLAAQAWAEDAWAEEDEPRPRVITPGRILLFLLLIASGGVALYGIFLDRTPLQIPLTVSGLAIFGVLLAVLALVSARVAAALGRTGSAGRAFIAAFFGGLCAFGAAGSLAGALVLGIVAGTV
jgi:hypothetical protein